MLGVSQAVFCPFVRETVLPLPEGQALPPCRPLSEFRSSWGSKKDR